MPKVGVIDYGVGNLFSISRALNRVGFDVNVIDAPEMLKKVDAVVLPGVGGFRVGSKNLRKFQLEVLRAIAEGTPLLGVCLGLQLLFESSEEGPGEGLKSFEGKVIKFPANVKIPHMGWNTVEKVKNDQFLDGVKDGDYFYFVHSYYPKPLEERVVAAKTDYGLSFPSVLSHRNIFGTQFHPEKSGENGARVLNNFLNLVKR